MHILELHEPGQTPLPHADQTQIAVGIDLGTTNSLIAIARAGKPEVLRQADGKGMLPSVVAYPAGDAPPVVGDAARHMILDDADLVVSSIKRLMGRSITDIKALSGTLPFTVEPAENTRMLRLKVGQRKLTPVEISADILRALKHRAEAALGHDVGRAVITVPAYFDDAARTATRDAARLAGFEVLRLVNEPTAAALAYGLDKGAEGCYAIYDLGGGTFDISVLRLERGVFQVLATGGDAALGGDDFDHAIAEHFIAERRAQLGPEQIDPADVKRALGAARLAKECLTTQSSGDWVIDVGGRISRHFLDVTALNRLIAPLVERTLVAVRMVLQDADLAVGDITGVVLVGGSTRVPLVRARVAELFGQAPLSDIDPDEVVALGAALQAEALSVGSDTLLLDVIPLSLGIETMGGLVEKVIPRNAAIPTAQAQEFTTYADGQTAMLLHVVQGERELADQNRSLARFELKGIPAMTAGAARIRVTFAVDADGLLTVSAEEKTTGIAQHIEVKPSYGLTEDEMATMLHQAMENAGSDMTRRLVTEARVEADRSLLALRAALTADGDLLNIAERQAVDDAIGALEQTLAGNDRGAILTASEALEKATQDFATRRMDRGIATALKGVGVDTLDRQMRSGDSERG